jgi:CDP-glucose 4,6-dehydratase
MNPNFWKGKKVLITGHTGFKGSWLSLWLQHLDSELVGFSNTIPTDPSLFEDLKNEKYMTSVTGDIRKYNDLKNIISEFKPEIIFHLAAQSLVHHSYENPLETYSTNVMGTVNILEAIRETKIPKIMINVTSDKCYKNIESSKGNKESDELGGYDPYSNSKACAELVTESYRNSFFNISEFLKHGTSISSVRAGNVIGGGDWAKNRLIPDIFRGIINNHEIKIRNPGSIRPWQHVLDPLKGYMILAEKLWNDGSKFSEAWNFGPSNNEPKTVSWIFDKINQYWKTAIEASVNKEKFNHESKILILNSEKAKLRLGWESKIKIELGIKLLVDWYKQYEQEKDMRKISLEQIKMYEKLG